MIDHKDLQFQILEQDERKGSFVIEPLERGYGYTLGNSLRRVLLSSLPGAALTELRVSGVSHQFTTIPGVKEDVVQITLDLKKIRFRLEGDDPVALRVLADEAGEITAGDIEAPAGVEIINKDQPIATVTSEDTELEMELLVEPGYGYVPAEDHESDRVGVIPLDAVFSPVLNVSFDVESTRVGQITNLDRLIVNVETDGSIKPFEAMLQASETLMQIFYKLSQGETEEVLEEEDEEPRMTAEEERLPLEDLELPTRVTNSLKKGDIETCGDLVNLIDEKGMAALTEIQNVGEKSVIDVREKVLERGWRNEKELQT
ncbi:MAG: DNA-directed RNA polymerase subunit alpha [Patescibacteria group bacterium]